MMKDIPNYEGLYSATEDGRIWSYPKRINSFKGKWLKLQIMTNTKNRNKPRSNYMVYLYKNGEGKRFLVHRLVALTFIPNPENKPQINHKDGNPLNNNVNNLEWVTSSENIRHGIKNGLINNYTEKAKRSRSENGKKTGAINSMKYRRIFTFAEAECIRAINKYGKKSCRAIARVYNCSNKTISNICNYKTYLVEV